MEKMDDPAIQHTMKVANIRPKGRSPVDNAFVAGVHLNDSQQSRFNLFFSINKVIRCQRISSI
jgi:hypothetical protein